MDYLDLTKKYYSMDYADFHEEDYIEQILILYLQSDKKKIVNIKEIIDRLAPEEPKETIEEMFLKTWVNYPRKEGKKQALRFFKSSYKKYGSDVVDKINKAISIYKEEPREKKFIKMGGTFYNNWEDYYEIYLTKNNNKVKFKNKKREVIL
jgi:hypothetical protein